MSGVQDFPFGIEDVTELLHLRIRRRCSDGAYVDCPFCGEGRGRMKINYVKNVWRCNYCNEHGGMLALYARIHNLTNSEAYREICDFIQNGIGYSYDLPMTHKKKEAEVEPVNRADNSVIHKTLTGLLGMLKLSEQHREHLRNVRGLSDEQIEQLGYKSTPPFYMCGPLTSRLIEQGYTVEGVPGFYQKDSKWTVNFSTMTAGILIPARGIDGMICGFQIRLDVPLKNDDGNKDKPGAKYIWFSSGSKPMGTTAGSPLHFVGDPFARIVYVTEGILKSDIAHMLMDRTFAAIAGINNTAQLDMLFALLAENGTQTIIEAADMDKYRNEHVNKGASTIYLLAKKHGLSFRRLTWNPNYKGIDDWQLAVRRSKERKENRMTNFKTRFLYGLCGYDTIDDEITKWRECKETELSLHEYLGFTKEEYAFFLKYSREKMIRYLLDCQQLSDTVSISWISVAMPLSRLHLAALRNCTRQGTNSHLRQTTAWYATVHYSVTKMTANRNGWNSFFSGITMNYRGIIQAEVYLRPTLLNFMTAAKDGISTVTNRGFALCNSHHYW